MPANSKYLTTSGWQKTLKISAGILGGYFVSVSFHLALASWVNHVNVMITMTFTGFILWGTLMVLAFIAKNGVRAWEVYLSLTLFFSVIVYLGKTFNPDFLHG